jgi:cytochrome c biogenesis protein CcmG/thiol:disulfide interchange protein DsbE
MMGRILPLILFLLLAVLLAVGLKIADKKTQIPSPLIGKTVPPFSLPVLNEPDRILSQNDFLGEPYLVNFWASWCVTCRAEHPYITELAESGLVKVIGLNFRDEPEDATQWLARYGDPYYVNITDLDGRISIDFGVYAAPESFLINPDGRIVFKQLGMLTPDIINTEIIPLLRDMKRQNP